MLFITKDVTHIQLDKIFLQQLSNHKPVPAQPGMFFDNEGEISICHRHNLYGPSPGERHLGVPIIIEKTGVCQMVYLDALR